MKDFFYAIQDLFVNYLFAPYDYFRELELENWWSANIVSWLFLVVGFVAFLYWMKELRIFNNNGEEDKTVTAHSYL
ncbi:uracil phosphoribosyltransferase [Winogradskyella sp. 3972H.M.0a.05]|uniref:DUF6341 family protein n=1 Tax=Winogradskyella sp. 3972H.M.0a.05 TaxID=2950277 RepID=UPI00339A034D